MPRMMALRPFQSIAIGNLEAGQTFDARDVDVVQFQELGLARLLNQEASKQVQAAPEPVKEPEVPEEEQGEPKSHPITHKSTRRSRK